MASDRVPTSVRIPVELHEKLAYEAERRDVSVQKVVEWALRRGLPLLAPLPDDPQPGQPTINLVEKSVGG